MGNTRSAKPEERACNWMLPKCKAFTRGEGEFQHLENQTALATTALQAVFFGVLVLSPFESSNSKFTICIASR